MLHEDEDESGDSEDGEDNWLTAMCNRWTVKETVSDEARKDHCEVSSIDKVQPTEKSD